MKPLNQKQIKTFRAQAHHLNPVIMLGDKGLTEAVAQETEIALLTHELIKVKINGADREERVKIADELAKRCQAHLVQMIGRMVVLYRENEARKNSV